MSNRLWYGAYLAMRMQPGLWGVEVVSVYHIHGWLAQVGSKDWTEMQNTHEVLMLIIDWD